MRSMAFMVRRSGCVSCPWSATLFSLIALLATSCDSGGSSTRLGILNGPCDPNDECDDGLVCEEGVCVAGGANAAVAPREPDGLAKTVVVTAAGATIEVTAEDNPYLAGTRLVIPPGALNEPTTVTVSLGFDAIVSPLDEVAGPVVILEPADTLLSSPATLTIPMPGASSSDAAYVRVRDAVGELSTIASPALVLDGALGTYQITGFVWSQGGTPPQAGQTGCGVSTSPCLVAATLMGTRKWGGGDVSPCLAEGQHLVDHLCLKATVVGVAGTGGTLTVAGEALASHSYGSAEALIGLDLPAPDGKGFAAGDYGYQIELVDPRECADFSEPAGRAWAYPKQAWSGTWPVAGCPAFPWLTFDLYETPWYCEGEVADGGSCRQVGEVCYPASGDECCDDDAGCHEAANRCCRYLGGSCESDSDCCNDCCDADGDNICGSYLAICNPARLECREEVCCIADGEDSGGYDGTPCCGGGVQGWGGPCCTSPGHPCDGSSILCYSNDGPVFTQECRNGVACIADGDALLKPELCCYGVEPDFPNSCKSAQ